MPRFLHLLLTTAQTVFGLIPLPHTARPTDHTEHAPLHNSSRRGPAIQCILHGEPHSDQWVHTNVEVLEISVLVGKGLEKRWAEPFHAVLGHHVLHPLVGGGRAGRDCQHLTANLTGNGHGHLFTTTIRLKSAENIFGLLWPLVCSGRNSFSGNESDQRLTLQRAAIVLV